MEKEFTRIVEITIASGNKEVSFNVPFGRWTGRLLASNELAEHNIPDDFIVGEGTTIYKIGFYDETKLFPSHIH